MQVSISVTTITVTFLWMAGAAFIGLAFFSDHPFAAVGIYITAGAATIQVRGFISDMEQRERVAFDLGRDSVRNIR